MNGAQKLIIALLFSGGLINYMDRAAFGVLAPLIAKDLALSPVRMGMVFSAFSISYTAFAFFGGWASDHFSSKRVIGTAMSGWSLFCGLTALAGGFFSLILLRIAFGAGEAPFVASANKMISGWFSRERYAAAFALSSAGQPLGGVVAGPLVGLVAATMGWRIAFVVIAAMGFVWLLVWGFLAREAPADVATRASVVTARDELPSIGRVILSPPVLGASLTMFTSTYFQSFFLTWYPTYLTSERGLTMSSMSLVSAIPWSLAVVGLVSGGFLSDWLTRIIGDPVRVRRNLAAACLAAAAVPVALIATMPPIGVTIMLASIGMGAVLLAGSSIFALLPATVPPARLGAANGFMIVVASLGAILSPLVTGYIVQTTASFSAAFLTAAGVIAGGAMTVFSLARLSQRPLMAFA